jgi:predicted RNA-binding Zn-ribbon protein involved in translation (DUF1610 family)
MCVVILSTTVAGRCVSCGGELVERLGDVECANCGQRVLRSEAPAARTARDASAAPWEPPSPFTAAAAAPQRDPQVTQESTAAVEQLGLYSGGMYRPRLHEVASPRLAVEKWIFLAAFFLGSIFVTYAFLNSGGPDGAQGVAFMSVAIYVSLPTAVAAFVAFSRSGSVKNGCLFLVIGSVLFGAFSIYKAATAGPGRTALLAGLIVQTLIYGWLAAILLRENELE